MYCIDQYLPDDFSGNALEYLIGEGFVIDEERNMFGDYYLRDTDGRIICSLVPRTTTPGERYDAANTVQVKLKLNSKTDADILKKLAEVPNKQGYIKALIRSDLANK